MQAGDYQVDLIDNTGKIIGYKRRGDIIKGVDAYHAVYCVLTTPTGELVLNLIASRADMPNLHAGKYGCTAATIKRTGETGDEAATRAVREELNINKPPTILHEELLEIDGTYRLIGWYNLVAETPKVYNREDIDELVPITKSDFEVLLKESPEKITPPLKKYWEISTV